MNELTAREFAHMTDLACVKAETRIDELREMAELANKWNFAGVYALPSHNSFLKDLLCDNQNTFIGGAVGFPSGGATTSMKVFETKELLEFGCAEIDMVVNITWLKAGLFKDFKKDIEAVIDTAEGKIVKTIIECHHLTNTEIRIASELAAEAGSSFIKTATGWPDGGASYENIKIIAEAIKGANCGIKAAGGIKDIETASNMVRLGVSRFGCSLSSAKAIIGEDS